MIYYCRMYWFAALCSVCFGAVFAHAQGVSRSAFPRSHGRVVDSLEFVVQGLLKEPCTDTATVHALNNLAIAYWTQNPEQSTSYAAQALAVAESIGDLRGVAQSFNILGMSYDKCGRYEVAIESYFKSLKLSDELLDNAGIARASNNIGSIYVAQEKYDIALEYYFKALKAFEAAGDKQRQAYTLNNIGEAYHKQDNDNRALEYYTKSLKLMEQNGDKSHKWSSLNNIGIIYTERGKHSEALQYHFRALGLLQEFGNSQGQSESFNNIGKSYKGLGDNSKALEFAWRALVLADSIGIRPQKQDVLGNLSEIYAALGDSGTSFMLYKQYIALRDTLMSEDTKQRIAQIREQYESVQKEQQIVLLTKDAEIHNTVRNSLLGGTILLAMLLGIAVNRYSVKKKANERIVQSQLLIMAQTMEIQSANVALREHNAMLETLNNEKSEFLGIAAHSLKNPLTSIVLASGVMKNHQDQISPEKLRKRIGDIERTALRMRDTVNDLLNITMIESGQLAVSLIAVNAIDLVHEIVHNYDDWAAAKQIRLLTTIPEAEALVLADEARLYEVLENLVSNAIKYSPRGKNIWVEVKKHSSGLLPGPCYLILVKDEGPGLSDEDKSRVFGKFARLSAQPTAGEHSSGLGLSIVKRVVEAMNGRVWCESEFGDGLPSGATFVVELPSASQSDRTASLEGV